MTQRPSNDYCRHGYPDFGRLCPACSPWPSDRLVVGRHVTIDTRDGVTTIRRRSRRRRTLELVAGVAAVLVLSIAWPAPGSAANEPPVLHIGPPATWQDVACSRARLADAAGNVVLVIERCYRTKPVRIPRPSSPCTLVKPCPIALPARSWPAPVELPR